PPPPAATAPPSASGQGARSWLKIITGPSLTPHPRQRRHPRGQPHPVAELTRRVRPPAPDGAVLPPPDAGVRGAGRDVVCVGDAVDDLGPAARAGITGAELALVVRSPAGYL